VSLRVKLSMLIGLIGLGAVAGRTALGAHFEAAELISTLRELGTSALAVPLFVLLFGVATSLFTPAVAFMISAGVTWGFWPGWAFVWLAANVWAHVHFLVGRWVAGDALKRWIERRGATWLLLELAHGGGLTTIMVRQLPLPFSLVNMTAGASPLPWHQWAWGNALGLIPNCLIYTQLAAALAEGAAGARETVALRVVLAAAGVISLSLVSRWLQRRFAPVRVGAGR
jgi:uncharacterized membrane protein YdjX (TVP38/TMEM64 family)